jgi:hypothetical protein
MTRQLKGRNPGPGILKVPNSNRQDSMQMNREKISHKKMVILSRRLMLVVFK